MNKHTFFLAVILFTITSFSSAQDCGPTTKSKDGSVNFYGGNIREGLSLITDDSSTYSFYIAQGKGETVAYVSFRESIKNRKEYNKAITDYLNESKLKHSYLEIEINNKTLHIPYKYCSQKAIQTLGSIYAYDVHFEGSISKNQIIELQNNEITNFKFVIGDKPYERRFKKSTKFSRKIKKAINCVNLDNMIEINTKTVNELDLTEVLKKDYSKNIIGQWLLQADKKTILEFNNGSLIISKAGKIISKGTYKIIRDRLIYTGTLKNGASKFELFLKDMIILLEDGKEYTYERIVLSN